MFNFLWLAGLVNGLEPHLQALSNQKMKCSFLDYVQLLMISQAGRWTRTTCATLSRHKMKCLFLDYIQLLIGCDGRTQTPCATPLQPKKWNVSFLDLHSTSDDQPGWSMDSNPICHPSPARKMKCLFLDYFQFLVISQADQWTQTPSTCPLKPKKWNAHFWITFTFWWSAGLVDGLKPHLPPLSRHKIKCSFLHYVQLVMIAWAGQWTQTPSATPLQPKKWNANFWIMFNFW